MQDSGKKHFLNLPTSASSRDRPPSPDPTGRRRHATLRQWKNEENGTGEIPHFFTVASFSKPTFCDECKKFIWGISKQGVECQNCNLVAHQKCQSTITSSCKPKPRPEAPSVNPSPPISRSATRQSFEKLETTPPPSPRISINPEDGEAPSVPLRSDPIVESPFDIQFISTSDEVCAEIADLFIGNTHVEIIKGILPPNPVDCWVANGTSFGLWPGSRTASCFDEGLAEVIQKKIEYEFLGEQPLGSSLLFETGNQKFPTMIHIAIRKTTSTFSIDPYAIFRSVMLEVIKENRRRKDRDPSTSPIRSIAFFLSANTFDRMELNEVASDIYNAYYSIHRPPTLEQMNTPQFRKSIVERNFITPESDEAREKQFLNQLKDGTIASRDFVSNYQLNYLQFLLENEDHPDLQITSAKILSDLCRSQGPAFVVKLRNSFTRLVELASSGSIDLHNQIEMSDLDMTSDKFVAEGAEAKVFKAVYKGKKVAVKKFHEGSLEIKPTEIRREIAIMSLLNHPNLVHFLGAKLSKTELFVVTEFIENGSLKDYLTSLKEPIPQQQLIRMCMDVCRGMEYLHSNHVMHRDLKSFNLLVDKYLNLKICDFGVSKITQDKQAVHTGYMGTVAWMAPEVFSVGGRYSFKADVYSFGVIMWEMVTLKTPFENISNFSVPMAVTKGERPELDKDVPSWIKRLIKASWHQNPKNRPDFSSLLIEFTKASVELKNGWEFRDGM